MKIEEQILVCLLTISCKEIEFEVILHGVSCLEIDEKRILL